MRNLKRALSLALASVMVLGLMVVGSSAKGYDDVTSEENVEAIEVLQAVGIMTGDENGNFNPTQNVTRNEMAVIMSNLMDYRVATYKGTSPFTDVPEWAEPYVAACYTNGIIAGYSATTFGGSDPVVTSQATLMVLKALGYFQYQQDFGDDWQLATINQANRVDLLADVDSAVRVPMTRNDVAQLVLNGLEAGTVEADTSSQVNVTIGDAQVSVGGTKYNYVTIDREYAYAISSKIPTAATSSTVGAIVELGEKLYQGDLTKKDAHEDDNTDDFGRPADTWAYQAKDIGTYAQSADQVFTAKVTAKALYNAVGTTAAEKYTWTIKNNGWTVYESDPKKDDDNPKKGFPALVKHQTNDSDEFFKKTGLYSDAISEYLYSDKDELTGNGVLTEIYVDGTKETVIVAVTDFYAAEVYQVKDGQITLSSIESDAPADTSYEFDAEGFEEDEIVYYSFAKEKIQSVEKADRIEGEVTKVVANTNDVNGKNFDLDGSENYKYLYTMDTNDALITDNVANNMVGYTMTLGGKAYCLYIDWAAVTYDYAYVLSIGTDTDKADSTGTALTVWARLVLTDGSMITVETDEPAPNRSRADGDDGLGYLRNHIVSYSKNSNGVYTLKVKDDGDNKTKAGTNGTNTIVGGRSIFENGHSKITNAGDNTRDWTANNNTVFIVAESGTSWNDWSFSVYTGVENIPDIDSRATNDTRICVAASEKGVAKVVYVENADVSGSGHVLFVVANSGADVTLTKDGTRYYNLTAYEDGQKIDDFNVKWDSEAYNALVSDNGIKKFQNEEINAAPLNKNGDFKTATKFAVPLRVVTRNADNLVTSVKFYGDYDVAVKNGSIAGKSTTKNDNGAVGLGTDGSWYVIKDARQVRYDAENDSYSTTGIASVKNSTKDCYVGVIDDNDLIGLFVVDWPEPGDGSGTGTDTSEGTGDVTMGDGTAIMDADTKGDIGVDRLGNVGLTVAFKAPNWAKGVNETPGTDVDFTVTISDDKGPIVALDESKFSVSLTGEVYSATVSAGHLNDLKTAIEDGKIDADQLTAKVTNVKWANANVKYVYDTKTGADASKLVGVDNDGVTSSTKMKVGAAETPFAFTATMANDKRQAVSGGTLTYEIVNASEVTAGSGVRTGNWTDTTAVNLNGALKADGGDFVYVIIKGTEAQPAAKTYTVTAREADKVLFAVVAKDAASVSSSDVPNDDSKWGTSATAEAGQTILVKAVKTGVSVTGLTAVDDTTHASVSLTNGGVISTTAVYKFTMPAQSVEINTVSTSEPTVQAASMSAGLDKINVKLEAGSVINTDGKAANEAEMDFVAGYIKGKSFHGVTIKDAVTTKNAAGNVTGIRITSADGSQDVTLANIKVDTGLSIVRVGSVDVVLSDNGTTAKIEEALELAGVTMDVTASTDDVTFVLTNTNNVGTYTNTGITGVAADGLNAAVGTSTKEILVNGGHGYAKMAATALTMTNTGATGQSNTNKPTLALATASAALTKTDSNSDVYYPIDVELTIEATVAQANAGDYDDGVKLKADTTVGTNCAVTLTGATQKTGTEMNAASADVVISIKATITEANTTAGAAINLTTENAST